MERWRNNAAWMAWRQQVLEQVRFWPDRCDIGEELEAHYADHVRDLERVGYEPKLAEERALHAMGEAEAVGKAFDAVHQPWLGWLWEASRGLVLLAVFLLAVSVFTYDWPPVARWLAPEVAWDVEYDYPLIGEVKAPEPVRMGSYTISVANSRYWSENNEKAFLELILLAETPKFWLEGPAYYDLLEAVDSEGEQYTCHRYPRILSGGTSGSHGRSACTIQLYGFEQSPEWVEIRHTTAGWTMRVELPPREEVAS